MTLAADVIAIFDYFDANFSGTSVVQHGINEPLNNPTAANYVRISVIPVTANQVSLGDNAQWRTNGFVSFDIFTKTNSGPLAHETIRDEIEALFKRKVLGSIHFQQCQRAEIGIEGQFYHTNLTINFYRTETVTVPA